MLAILAATAAGFLIGGAYYAVLGARLAEVSGAASEAMPPWKIGVELLRCLALAAVLAFLVSETGTDEVGAALLLGLVLWVGFPAVLLTGAMVHDDAPLTLAAIHGGDWLLKLLVLTAIVSAWQ
jgi:Protein of unknown function (DUF1761)